MKLLITLLLAVSTTLAASDFSAPARGFVPERYGWARGEVRWFYDPAGEPQLFKWGALPQIFVAMLTWEHACGVKFKYQGEVSRTKHIAIDGVSVVGWETEDSIFSGWAVAWIIHGRVREADVVLNIKNVTTDKILYNTMLHEVGHMIGLPHSKYEGNLMSGPPFTSYYWPGYITPFDAEDCIHLYGPPKLEY